jgi:assemBly factor CBP4
MFNSRKARILALAEQQKQQIARENQKQKRRKRLEQQ